MVVLFECDNEVESEMADLDQDASTVEADCNREDVPTRLHKSQEWVERWWC